MTLVNLPYSTHPGSPADLMALAALSFGIRPTPGAGGAVGVAGPRLRLTRCTLVLPDEEVAFLRGRAEAAGAAGVAGAGTGEAGSLPEGQDIPLSAQTVADLRAEWMPITEEAVMAEATASGEETTVEGNKAAAESPTRRARAAAEGASIPLSPGSADESSVLQLNLRVAGLSTAGAGMLVVERLELQPAVLLLNCTLLSASAYAALPGAVPLLPQSRVWPPLLLHANRTRALSQGPSGLSLAPGLEAALMSQDRVCGQTAPGGATIIFVARRHDDTVTSAGQDPNGGIAVGGGEAEPGAGWSRPGPAAADICTMSGYAPELVGGRTFTDLKGAAGRCGLVLPLRLRNLVLYNLAPAGGGPLLGGGDVAWANSSLPLWYFRQSRSASPDNPAPLLLLDNLTLVVPEPEWRALAAAVLAQHAPQALATAQMSPRPLRLAPGPPVSSDAGMPAESMVVRLTQGTQPPQPSSDTTRTLLAFAAASKPLSLDTASGVLILASARHYGWYGTHVTITFALPPDAPPGASLLPHPELTLPYQELADITLEASVDFTVAAPPATPGPAAPSAHDPSAQLPQSQGLALKLGAAQPPPAEGPKLSRPGGNLPWVPPLAIALPAGVGSALLLIALMAATVVVAEHYCAVHQALMHRMAARAGVGHVPPGQQGEGGTQLTAARWEPPSAAVAGPPLDDEAFQQEASVYFCELQDRLAQLEGLDEAAAAECATAEGARGGLAAAIRALKAELADASDLHVSSILGRGSFGVVYAGRWRSLPVAVKALVVTGVEVGLEGWRRQQAMLEAAISLSMAHENVVGTYTYVLKPLVQQAAGVQQVVMYESRTPRADDTREGGSSTKQDPAGACPDAYKLYIVQELCNGGSLQQALAKGMAGGVRKGGSGRLLALRLALDVARGVAHVHACRIVHGDLKPDNVLLVVSVAETRDAALAAPSPAPRAALVRDPALPAVTAKVADFGLSLPLPEDATHQSKRYQGTPSRMAPEVADFGLSLPLPEDATHQSKRYQGTPSRMAPEVIAHGRLSTRSDVWSYGTMLIEFFYGCTIEGIAAVYAGMMGARFDMCAALDLRGEHRHLCALLLEDMLTSPEQEYCQLTATCFAIDPRKRPDFATIVSRLENILGRAEEAGPR
ncbi:hypothetical protein GPECTOR_44g84 [Gonium pectorale]|uniref:Protein kinase domain-containing protein n=1 Tax=Gonium pectorale TaxID=33097 RepID=A0A150GAN3_GONPE|nr:hypothetical protein GPECTOR_44g84 [Gonium pectorale]|eukprot:KXZ46410.1 hypothetical protein GPECTOR_44g84 [Gonium pectorale]